MNEVKKSTEAPPAPPPPSILLFSQETKLSPQTLKTTEITRVGENKLDLAINRLLSSEERFNRVFYIFNTPVTPQLQDGPKCGLVALSIATSVGENFVNVEDIFQAAVSHGVTKQGEMFSADALALLAENCCNFKTRIINGGLQSHTQCIIRSLLRKCLLLVPYDADFNHAPCCKRGIKAHWAVVTGFVILKQENSDNNNFIKINSRCSSSCNCLINNSDIPLTISHQEEGIIIGKASQNITPKDVQEGKIILIGLQGKSKHIGLWGFNEMADSNNNLSLFSTNRDCNCYLLPEGGLEEGLKGKAVILSY